MLASCQVGGDDEISLGTTVLALKDPLSGARVKTPVRFRGTNGLASFDLDTFVTMAQRSRKWQCPHSMRHSRIQELQIDGFILPILESLKVHCSRIDPYLSTCDSTWSKFLP